MPKPRQRTVQLFTSWLNLPVSVSLRFYDPPVVHVGDNVCKVKNARVVRDDDRSAIWMNGVRGDQLHHSFPGRVIKRGSRFVADDQPWLVNQSPRDRHALLLASRQRGGPCVAPPNEAQLIEQRLRTTDCFRAFHSGRNQRDRRVFGGCQGWQPIELLENEAHVFTAKQDSLVGSQAASATPEQFHLTFAWIKQASDDA